MDDDAGFRSRFSATWPGMLLASVLVASVGVTSCASSSENGSHASQLPPVHPAAAVVELAYAPLVAVPDWVSGWRAEPPQPLRPEGYAPTVRRQATAAHSHVQAVVTPAAPATTTPSTHTDPHPADSWSSSTNSVTHTVPSGGGGTTTTITTTKTTTIDGNTTQGTHVQTIVSPR